MRLFILIAALFAFSSPVMARTHHSHGYGHHHYRHHATHHRRHVRLASRWHHHRRNGDFNNVPQRHGLVTIQTAANPITVAPHVAGKFKALIADLVAHGYRGHVNCYASHGHVPHSKHYTGEGCDFAQTGWGRVSAGASIMYRARAIIAAHGLRDGCTFRDCGHVDNGAAVTRRYASAGGRYARRGRASVAALTPVWSW